MVNYTLITRGYLLYPPTFLDLLSPVFCLFLTLSHQGHAVSGKQQTESGGLRGGRERVLNLLNASQGEVTPNFYLREAIGVCVCVCVLMKPLVVYCCLLLFVVVVVVVCICVFVNT